MADYDRTLGFLGPVNRVNAAAAYMSHHRASPHLSHLDHPSSSSTTHGPSSSSYPPYHAPHLAAVMSQQQNSSQARPPPPQPSPSQQQQQQQPGQPSSYPSPRSYPSPSMSAYAYPPPQQQQTVEPYRASPTGSHVSLPNLNLPPLRAIDPRHPPQGQAQGPMGSPLPPPVAPMGAYYHAPPPSMPPHHHQQPPPHPNVTSSPHPQPLRYSLPSDGRIMSGGRHKKEIKRRTKTGCLTCRKRRIKCDEAHPTCRNCQKSKRECLGYDPIFKAQPSPAAIQPAPTGTPNMTPTSAVGPGSAPPYSGYNHPVNNQFAAALSTGASSPGSSVEPYDYSAAIDPALEAAGPAPMGTPNAYDGAQGFRQDLKRGLGSTSPYSSSASDAQASRGGANPAHSTTTPVVSNGHALNGSAVAHTGAPAKPIKIDDLLTVGGDHPPPLTPPTDAAAASAASTPLSQATLDQIKHVFVSIYAPSIDNFLETTWFQSKSLPVLMADARLCELFASLIERFSERYNNSEALPVTQSMETRVLWRLMCLCRTPAGPSTAPNGSDNPSGGANAGSDDRDFSAGGQGEAIRRLRVLENLLTGNLLDSNPANLSRISNVLRNDQSKFRELEFWRHVGKFLTLRDNEASSAREIDETMTACRNLLDNHENRDIIYSAAVVRHIGQRGTDFPNHLSEAVSNDEKDNGNRLRIAKTFIENEARGSATNTVLQRLCDLIIRSWTVMAAASTAQ
ncbi:MAG: hypothetical protein M4579_007364 [Chaenotheca gracillima]|nr:MAG: hypothetical protein M4579_007364 [Chaenotheca gracillima]